MDMEAAEFGLSSVVGQLESLMLRIERDCVTLSLWLTIWL